GEPRPEVVVMDVTMPDLNGIEATRRILASCPRTRILALSMHADKRFVTGMLQAGATGYLLKDCAAQELAGAITTVAAGQSYLSPAIAGIIIEDYLGRIPTPEAASFSVLSEREREVLQLIAEGCPTRQIAQRLFVSVKTVETHRRQIMKKLDLHSVADLTKYAVREGLTSLDI
ncbi:MAG: response regulator transcription factor, partial [Thermodesulfobacteriota bacterium]